MSSGVRLAVWSGPRNISTALMRSFENRPDCRVVDEPLYAHYLASTGLDHPGREEVIAAGETSVDHVVSDLTAPVEGVYYQKHMAQHLIDDVPREWIAEVTNVLLIRHPAEVVSSYRRTRPAVEPEDIGIVQQAELYEQLDGEIPVIDSADFLQDPEGYLRWLCHYVGIDFTAAMLRWPAGARDSDGVWARYWYDAVLASTGFEPYRRRDVDLDAPSRAVVASARPHYERLHASRVRP